MSLVKILIDNKIPFIQGALDDVAEVKYLNGSDIRPADVKNADALIIRTRTICNELLLEKSGIKFIASATIGFDHIDTDYCTRNGIAWTNAPGCNSSSVEQYYVSVILELTARRNLKPENLSVGIVGVGNVGSKVARVSEALGMKVLLNDPPRLRQEGGKGFVSLDLIKKEADIISFHVPLSLEGDDRTYKMADCNFFDSLSRPVHFINTSRGPVIDEVALINALHKGTILSATLDVWENEPFINHNLLLETDFATPHIAGYSTDGKANGTEMSVQAVSRFFGLGKDNWRPEDIPVPDNNPVDIDCLGFTEMDIIREVFLETYSVAEDDRLLRADISRFESLRGNYRVRREPQAFFVHLRNNKFENLVEKLEKLGFSVSS